MQNKCIKLKVLAAPSEKKRRINDRKRVVSVVDRSKFGHFPPHHADLFKSFSLIFYFLSTVVVRGIVPPLIWCCFISRTFHSIIYSCVPKTDVTLLDFSFVFVTFCVYFNSWNLLLLLFFLYFWRIYRVSLSVRMFLFNKYINVWHTFTALKYFAVAFRYFWSRHHREFRIKCRFLLYGSANSWKTFVLLVAFKQSAHLSVSLYFSHFLFTIKIVVVVIFIFLCAIFTTAQNPC